MKKSRMILLVTMLLLVASTCTVWGTTYDDEGAHRNSSYTKKFDSVKTTFTAVGNNTQCYTTLYNKTSSGCHIDAMVREYNVYTGNVLNQAYNIGTKGAGETIHSGYLNRNYTSSLYYYEHSATHYQSPYQMSQIVDSYVYTAYQQ